MTTTPAPVQRTSETSIPLAWSIAATVLVAAIVNSVFAARFPYNAPVESIYAIGITIDLVAVGIVLIIRALAHRARPRAAPRPPMPSRTAIVGAVLALVGFVGWALSGIEYFASLAGPERARYMSGAGGAFFFGAAWVLGIIFGVASYRRDGGRVNTVLSVGSIILGLLVTAAVLVASIVYGLDLSD